MGIRPQQQSIWSPVERYIKNRFMGYLEPLVAREALDPSVLDAMPVRRILVIRQHDQLGDFLLSIPALRALRTRYPEAWIAVLVRDYFFDVARLVPYLDDVIVAQEDALRWTGRSFREFWDRLRTPWDLTVVLNTVSHSLRSDLLAFFSRGTVVLGSADRTFPGSSRNFFYHLNAPGAAGIRHQSERNLDIVRFIGCDTEDLREELLVPETEHLAACRELEERAISGSVPLIALHLGAGKPLNRWPADRFAALSKALREEFHAAVLVFWGPAEAGLRDEFVKCGESAAHLIGHPPLARLTAFLAKCDLVVCNDTGVMHLASAVGRPTIALFGPTDPRDWMPVGGHTRALSGENGDMRTIETETVVRECRAILERSGRHPASSAR